MEAFKLMFFILKIIISVILVGGKVTIRSTYLLWDMIVAIMNRITTSYLEFPKHYRPHLDWHDYKFFWEHIPFFKNSFIKKITSKFACNN